MQQIDFRLSSLFTTPVGCTIPALLQMLHHSARQYHIPYYLHSFTPTTIVKLKAHWEDTDSPSVQKDQMAHSNGPGASTSTWQ